jgi:hypothetical protein
VSGYARRKEREFTAEDLPFLWAPIHVAQKMGTRLGSSEVLLGSLSIIKARKLLNHAATHSALVPK